MKGIIGRFFFQFGMTVVFAVMVSWFVSFTLTPMLSSLYLKGRDSVGGSVRLPGCILRIGQRCRVSHRLQRLSDILEGGYERMEGRYRGVLTWALYHRRKVLVFAGGTFVLGLASCSLSEGVHTFGGPERSFVIRLQTPIDYSVDEVDHMNRRPRGDR
jgi:HAE1 family hydrophobic/amphiphilic exporter-1